MQKDLEGERGHMTEGKGQEVQLDKKCSRKRKHRRQKHVLGCLEIVTCSAPHLGENLIYHREGW